MEWYVGQPIVCIESLQEIGLIKGQEFNIKSIVSCPCCNTVALDVGIRDNFQYQICGICGKVSENDYHLRASRFAPLDVDISELTEILKQPIVKEIEIELA